MKIAYVGNFSQTHCTEVHLSKTLQNMGHEVVEIQEDPFNSEDFLNKVAGNDLFLFTRTWNNLVTLEHLALMKEMGILSASYHLDLYIGLQRESGLDNDPFWRTDYVFSPDGDPASQKIFESKGINHHYIKPGVFKEECYISEEITANNYDVIFVGGGSAYMHREWPYRRQLINWLQKTYGKKYTKFGYPERTVRNAELNQLYKDTKVVIGDSLCLNFTHPYYWSDRVYETLGRGGFIIHPFIEGMEDEFIDGENIVFYKFGDWNGLKEKIDYYLIHHEERNKIARAGHEFVKENATYNNRLQQMLDVIKSGGAETDPLSPVSTTPSLKINLGAGEDQFEGYVNVDLLDLPGIDVVHNLLHFPYPFEDNSADIINAVDLIEHLPNFTKDDMPMIIAFIEECYRILKPGGELYIQTPGYLAEFLWQDPTHVRGFHIKTFDLFDRDTEFGKTTGFYSKAKFKVKAEELENHNLRFWLIKR